MPPADVTYEANLAAKSSNAPGERPADSLEVAASKMNRLTMARPNRAVPYSNVDTIAAPAFLVNLCHAHENAPPTLYDCHTGR